jgi:lambda family phage portal protein
MKLLNIFKKKSVLIDTPITKKYARSFNGARFGRMEDLEASFSINADIQASLETLRGRCRHLAQNDPYVRKALNLWANNIIGPNGIDLHVQSRKANDELDDNPNSMIENLWWNWQRYGNCSTDGTTTFTEFCKIIIESVARDGEVLIVKKYGSNYGKNKFQLDAIPIESLDSSFEGIADNGNFIFQSVELDKNLRPVAYWIKSFDKNEPSMLKNFNGSKPTIRIPAEDCFHIFKKHYFGQIRGVPWIVTAILGLHHIDNYKISELEMARVASLKQLYFTMPANPDGISQEDIDQLGQMNIELKPGAADALPQGVEPKVIDFNSPNANMPDFLRAQLKGIASGLNLSYSSLANDLENINFSSAKYAALADQDAFQNLQVWFVDHFIDRVYRDWLLVQLSSNILSLPFSKYEKYCNVKWTAKGFRGVNLLETAKAAAALYDLGILSLTQISSELFATDWEETVQMIARENKKMDQLGVKLSNKIDILQLEQIDNNSSENK